MRKINNKLIDRMTKGDLLPLLDYIKSQDDLRLEIRRNNEAFIYYRKGKALEVRGLKVSKEYGDVPSTELAISNPAEYFRLIKKSIDNWLESSPRPEFDTQQNIARFNQDIEDKYIILDMEYAFEQNQIKDNEKREKKAIFDLLGIERKTNKIVFFEVKKGMLATKGKSGIDDHIADFRTHLFGKNALLFKDNLYKDVKNIIEDKKKLGVLKKFDAPSNLEQHDPELVFVFHPNISSEVTDFSRELQNRHKLFIVDKNNYKLK